SKRHTEVWNFHESAWREYRSAAWYVRLLREQGFEVEEGSGGMPTAFRATFGKSGPVVASYAEYDAVPGNSQDPVPYEKPRDGVHKHAAGHTDPHSALGLGALGGVLGAKAAMEKHGLAGTLVFFGEPAEKVCGSKPVHAAHGFYDGLDACISFHPAFTTSHANTVIWDTHCGSYWSSMYRFECPAPGGGAAQRHGQEIQKDPGPKPMGTPIHPAMSELVTPEPDELHLRAILPPWQKNYTPDDYTDYTRHCPTARLYVGRATLAAPEPGFQYPNWVWNALGGYPATID